MTMGAAVSWAVLSVVTFIVATKALGVWGCRRFQIEAGKDLSRGRNDPVSSGRSLRVSTAK